MDALYFDFEYRDYERAEELVLLSWMTAKTKVPQTIDLRHAEGRLQVAELVDRFEHHTWIAYNAQADLKCLLALGIDISGLLVIDAMAEARMVTLTHDIHWVKSQSLLSSLGAFGIPADLTSGAKDELRNLILSKADYSEVEWARIVAYGPQDILPLPRLMAAVSAVHRQVVSPVTIEEMHQRGEYVKAVAVLSFGSRGFPVDEARLQAIYGDSETIRRQLIESAVAQYGPIYWEDYSWSNEGFEELVAEGGYDWERTESGYLKLDKDYFKAQAQRYPTLEPLYQIRNLIRSLTGTDLRPLVVDGYVKPPIFTFSQKTGRNSPKPSQGFVLNLPPWLRTMIKPKTGRVFVGADWAQQEIAIAAGLSGDEALLAAYNNPEGDVYLALAKMAGVVPPGGTKQTHPTERKTFKAIQLGLGYGKGVRSLALDVFEANRDETGQPTLTLDEAQYRAEEIYAWHQETFSTYWAWLHDSIDQARVDEYLRSVDGWTYFVGGAVRDTQLLNFPLQSAGAAMMRRATIRIANTRSLDLVCSLHDAFYINCTEAEKREDVRLLIECMDQACEDILGKQVKIPVEVNVYGAQDGYHDPRADRINAMLQAVMKGRNEVLDVVGSSRA